MYIYARILQSVKRIRLLYDVFTLYWKPVSRPMEFVDRPHVVAAAMDVVAEVRLRRGKPFRLSFAGRAPPRYPANRTRRTSELNFQM